MLLLQLDIRKMLIYVNFSLKYEVFIKFTFKKYNYGKISMLLHIKQYDNCYSLII